MGEYPPDLPEDLYPLWDQWVRDHEPDEAAFRVWLEKLLDYLIEHEVADFLQREGLA